MRESIPVRIVNYVTRLTGILSGYAYLALSILIVFEILSRKVLNVSVQGVDEIGAYVVAVTGAFGLSLAAWNRAHTRIDVVLTRLPNKMRSLLDCLAYLALALGALFIASMAWRVLNETIEFKSVSSTPLQTPLWIPQLMWFAGLAFFSLIAAFMCIRGCFLFLNGSPENLDVLAPTSVHEELEDAIK